MGNIYIYGMKNEQDLIYDLIFGEGSDYVIDISEYIKDIYKYDRFIDSIKKVLKKSKVVIEKDRVDLDIKTATWTLKVKK